MIDRPDLFKETLQDIASEQGLSPIEFLHRVMQARLKDSQSVYKEPTEEDIERMASEYD